MRCSNASQPVAHPHPRSQPCVTDCFNWLVEGDWYGESKRAFAHRWSRLCLVAGVCAGAAHAQQAAEPAAPVELPQLNVEAKAKTKTAAKKPVKSKAAPQAAAAPQPAPEEPDRARQCQRQRQDRIRSGQKLQRQEHRDRHQDRHAAEGNSAVDLGGRRRADPRYGRANAAGSAALRAGRRCRRLRPRQSHRRALHSRHRGSGVSRWPSAHVQLLHLQLPHRSVLHGAHRGSARASVGALRAGAGRRHHQFRLEAPAGRAGRRRSPSSTARSTSSRSSSTRPAW